MKTLREMLTYRRPARSETESRFRALYLDPLGAEEDSAGNLSLEIPRHDGAPSRVLWSSHTDTVHWEDGFQRVARHGDMLQLAARERRSNCLGADCTAGVWLMREMARAGVPGLYVWHAAEERGGIGSRWRAKHPELFDGIEFAIAFDRRGTESVITHQFSKRCCSDAFATDFAEMLGLDLWPDPSGIFTDTAHYTNLVPECTNISVGYDCEHSAAEFLDTGHLLRLRDAILRYFDEDRLIAWRDHTAPDPELAAWDEPWDEPWKDRWTQRDAMLWFDRDIDAAE